MNKAEKAIQRMCETRWSAYRNGIKATRDKINQLVDLVEEMRDDTTMTLDTRSGARNLLPALCDFTFLAFLDLWNSILEETDQAQKYIQTPGLTLNRSLIKLRALETFLSTGRSALIEKAVSFATQKCEELGIETEKRIRRKKQLPGEAASDSDSGLSLKSQRRSAKIPVRVRGPFSPRNKNQISGYEGDLRHFRYCAI